MKGKHGKKLKGTSSKFQRSLERFSPKKERKNPRGELWNGAGASLSPTKKKKRVKGHTEKHPSKGKG